MTKANKVFNFLFARYAVTVVIRDVFANGEIDCMDNFELQQCVRSELITCCLP